uniref:RNA-binding protein n=1 Tax=Chlamydomonas euryale TaxID=1486919 RepID=A0A7R9Z590_9CHLO|mmetsp:Transcript_6/g.17  ORF Transcript_6/g.17 Transcript_6/m.17 type:complete len:544 (+) Transcript_6:806-2437(+)
MDGDLSAEPRDRSRYASHDSGRRSYSREQRGRDREVDHSHSYSLERARDSDERRSRHKPAPSPTVYLKNLPPEYEEHDIQRILAPFPNIVAIRLSRDRISQQSRGFAFVDFASENDAARLVEHADCEPLFVGGARLTVEFSIDPAPGRSSTVAQAPISRPAAADSRFDWMCSMCNSVNFARRTECYKCSAAQPANPQRAPSDMDGPSTVLKVSNLDPDCSETTLSSLFSAHAPLLDVRLVLDKFTGMPRGFAFVEYHSTSDATRAMNMLQGVKPAGAAGGLRICYARERLAPAVVGNASSAGHDALQAAQVMSQQYSSWEPKAFDGNADPSAAAWEPKAFGEEAAEEDLPDKEQALRAQGPQDSSVAANDVGQVDGTSRAGFVYDPTTGYWYDNVSGYYYDANTGLYYHRSTNQWYSYNQESGEYIVAGASDANTVSSSAAESAIAATESAMAVRAEAPKAAAERKRGAIIGASAQLSSQGLMQMVQLLDEKEQEAKALAAQKAAEDAKKQKQVPAPGAPANAPAGPVQGVIHKGKWASRKQV